MMKTKSIPFGEFRRFLLELGLGYRENRTDSSIVFHRATKDLLIFRACTAIRKTSTWATC